MTDVVQGVLHTIADEESSAMDLELDTWAADLEGDHDPEANQINPDPDESLEQALRNVKYQKEKQVPPEVRPAITKQPEVIDDFIRNFLISKGLNETLQVFETEWYEMKAREEANGSISEEMLVPDTYVHNSNLVSQVSALSDDLKVTKTSLGSLQDQHESLRKQRDFHKLSHSRVVQEKVKLVKDIRRLHVHNQTMEPMLTELRVKNESVMKERMLIRLEKEKLASKVKSLEDAVSKLEGAPKGGVSIVATEKKVRRKDVATWPPDERTATRKPLPPPTNLSGLSCRTTLKGHSMSVACVSIHPKKPVIATSSDDSTWKVWAVPSGELIMSGEGHKDWVSGVAFHPKGTHVATSSGDGKVKLWDIMKASCSHTFSDHTQSVWSVAWHDQGDFLASSSLDHTARIWDTTVGKLRQTLRGHVDSVNSVVFRNYSNMLATSSGDKTVSLWDPRSGFCVHTFYGHTNAVNHAAFSSSGDKLASVDADGMVVCHYFPHFFFYKKYFSSLFGICAQCLSLGRNHVARIQATQWRLI